ncbi:MAG: DciA family protein [Patescibacteria group bacterium]
MAGFESLKESLEKSWRRSPLKGAILAIKVEEALRELLPQETKMISFKEGKLILGTSSASQANNLFIQSRQIKKDINQALGAKVVERIRYRAQAEKQTG